jgi:hypothetical protein
MNIFKKCSSDFFRGLGAEFVFQTTDGISIISGGTVLKVRLLVPRPDETATRVVLVEADGKTHVIFEGSAISAAAKLVEIGARATSARNRVSVSRKGAYLALAAFTAIYLVFCHPAGTVLDASSSQASQSDINELLKAIPSVAGGMQGLAIPAIGKAGAVPGAASQPTVADAPGTQQNAAILDKPDFLNLPEDNKPAPAPAKDKSAAADTAVPAYSPDLYKDQPKTTDAGSKSADTTEVSAAMPQPVAEPAVAKTPDVGATVKGAPSVEQPVTAPTDPAAVLPAQTATPVATNANPKEAAPADPKRAVAEATKGKTASDNAALLQQIQEMMKLDPTSITPEMLDKLPHEMAQILRQTGVIDSPASMPEKGDAPYAAIRLPEAAIDKFRGKDGIASIPENDTYAALGNKIPLQLPGGGDIRKPEDLKLFGFKP